MLVERHNLSKYDLTVIHNGEDGILAIKYERPAEAQGPRIYDSYDWRHSDAGKTYTLVVPQQQQRNIEVCVVVRRTSTNRYEVTVARIERIDFSVEKTMNAVQDFLDTVLC